MNLLAIFIYSFLRLYRYSLRIQHKAKWKRKIKELIRTNGVKKLTSDQKKQIKKYYRNYGVRNVSTEWHQFYTFLTGSFSVEYIPEDLFFMDMEPVLNRQPFADTLSDKNLLEVLFQSVKQPESLVKNINGFYYSNNKLITEEEAARRCEVNHKMIIKPTLDTRGGRNVVLFKQLNGISDHKNLKIKELFGLYEKDFIVQRVVDQHPQMSKLNPTSLNTFRVMSYLNGTAVDILSIMVRMGKEGAVTDNNTGGGHCCGVRADGSLNATSFQGNTGKRYEATDQGIPFTELKLPFLDKIGATVKMLHKKAPYFKLISWDLAIDATGDVVLIEYNIYGQDVNMHQLNHGPVLSSILKEALRK